MNKKNITPNPSQPVDRVPSGQLPSALAELSEEAIGDGVTASIQACIGLCIETRGSLCSYDGDDAE